MTASLAPLLLLERRLARFPDSSRTPHKSKIDDVKIIGSKKNRPGFGGLADATEPGESSGAVLPEVAVLKEAAREAAN